MRNYRYNRKVNKIIGWAIIASFLLGFFGFLHAYYSGAYLIEDKDPFDKQQDSLFYAILHALFDAVGQFFFNRDKGGYMNLAIFISQFTAPLSMIGGVMVVVVCFQSFIDRIRGRYRRIRHGKVIAVYGDGEEKTIVSRSKRGNKRNQTLVYPENELFKLATDHIIYFRDDRQSIKFFEDNEKFFQKEKNVYMVFDQTDPFLFEQEHGGDTFKNVQFVNIDEIIAKDYWREHDLLVYKRGSDLNVRIAILGFSDLARKLLHYGVILNCYELDQQVRYYIWGDTALYENSLQDLNRKINDAEMKDRIFFKGDNLESAINQLGGMDRIILTDECWAEYVQTIIRKYPDKDIHFVDPEGSSLDRLRGTSVESYASLKDFDVNKIIREAEHALGKHLNARYSMIYGDHIIDDDYGEDPDAWKEKKWKALSPFLKESNDIAAEYHVIREKILYDHQCDVWAEQIWDPWEDNEKTKKNSEEVPPVAIIGLGTLGRKLLLKAVGSKRLAGKTIYISEKDYRKLEYALQAIRAMYPEIDVDERICRIESIDTEKSKGLPQLPYVIRTDGTPIPQIIKKTEKNDSKNVLDADEKLRELTSQDNKDNQDNQDNGFLSKCLDNDLCTLEHIRWCRFHYMNGWEYASSSLMKGKRKDEKRRLHSDLRRFDDLKEKEQTKDLEGVAVMLADPSLRAGDKVIDNSVRREIIQKLAIERYRDCTTEFWEKYKAQITGDDKEGIIIITGFDIAGIALVETFPVKAEESKIEFESIGDRGFLELMGMGRDPKESPEIKKLPVIMEIHLDEAETKDEPDKEGPDDEPVKEGTKDEPDKEGPDDEPVKEGPDDEPVKEGTKDEPSKEGPNDEPVKEETNDEPDKEGPDDRIIWKRFFVLNKKEPDKKTGEPIKEKTDRFDELQEEHDEKTNEADANENGNM